MRHVIYKYKNRKFYSTKLKRFITGKEVLKLSKDGDNLKILWQPNKNDITAAALERLSLYFQFRAVCV